MVPVLHCFLSLFICFSYIEAVHFGFFIIHIGDDCSFGYVHRSMGGEVVDNIGYLDEILCQLCGCIQFGAGQDFFTTYLCSNFLGIHRWGTILLFLNCRGMYFGSCRVSTYLI